MNLVTHFQILDEAVCISHVAISLEKGMYLIILSPAIGKLFNELGSFVGIRKKKVNQPIDLSINEWGSIREVNLFINGDLSMNKESC